MRTLVAGFALTFFAGSMVAQSPAPAPAHTFASAADVQALMAKANKERKPDQANFSQPLLTLAPYRANMEYRAVVGTPAVHTTEAEVFYVIDGAATLVTGGKLVDAKANAGGFAGSAIEGGETRQVAKGDFFIVPENTPHGFSAISQTLVLMTLHVPRPVPAAH